MRWMASLTLFFSNVGQKTNKTSSQNGLTDGSLIKSRRSGTTTRNDSAFTVDQISQSSEVLVVHINWTWNFTIYTKLTAHLLFLETSAAFTELLKISARNRCHVKSVTSDKTNIVTNCGQNPRLACQNQVSAHRPSD